jgi:N-acetyl sugar amidotransferase
MTREYQICTRCVMDTTDPDIVFSDDGACNHCEHYDRVAPRYALPPGSPLDRLQAKAERIRSARKGDYDSILGISGGIDSSYVAHLAGTLGLRPLVVHFDNGWNSEVAIANIEKIVSALGFDLYTYVINWPEFRDIQRAFLKASVIDIEMVSDHAIFASMYRLARKHQIKYVLSGTNFSTEHTMPGSWYWRKQDLINLKSIHKKFGTLPIKTFPVMPTWRFQASRKLGFGQTYVEFLNDIPYRRRDAIKTLEHTYDWRYYGGKHYESTFTKFYQAYILPAKYGIDKRRAHFTDLIHNAEMTREEAITALELPSYDVNQLMIDREYVIKKLGFSEDEFSTIMENAPIPHSNYASDQWQYDIMMKVKHMLSIA